MKLTLMRWIIALCIGFTFAFGCHGSAEMSLEGNLASSLRDLKSGDSAKRREAAVTIGEMGPKSAVRAHVADLLAAINDQNGEVRRAVILALMDAEAEANDVLPRLMQTAEHDSDAEVRAAALVALVHLCRDNEEIRDVLIKTLEDPNHRLRRCAASMLAFLGPKAECAVPVLTERLNDEDISVQVESIRAIGMINKEGHVEAVEKAVDLLTELTKDKERVIRPSLIRILSLFGAQAERAVPVLIAILEDQNEDEVTRSFVPTCLVKISADKSVLEILVAVLHGESLGPRSEAAKALGIMGPKAKTAIPELVEALSYGDWWNDSQIHKEAARALGNIGPSATSALRDLKKLSESGMIEVRVEALNAMAHINPRDPYPFTELLEMAGSSQPSDYRKAAIQVISELGFKSEFVDLIRNALHDKEQSVRLAAIVALASFGKKAADAIPDLRNLVENDPSGTISVYAYEAIKVLQGKVSDYLPTTAR